MNFGFTIVGKALQLPYLRSAGRGIAAAFGNQTLY